MRLIPSNSAAQKKHRCITPQKCVHILTPPADQPSTWAWAAFTIRAAARVASVRRRATVRAAARVASVRRRVAARAVLSIVLKALGDTVLTLHAVSLFAGATREHYVISIVLKALGDTVLTLHAVSLFAGATRRNGM